MSVVGKLHGFNPPFKEKSDNMSLIINLVSSKSYSGFQVSHGVDCVYQSIVLVDSANFMIVYRVMNGMKYHVTYDMSCDKRT